MSTQSQENVDRPEPTPRPPAHRPGLLHRARRAFKAQIDKAEQRREERRQVVLRLEPGTVIAPASDYEIGRASLGKECRSRWSPYH